MAIELIVAANAAGARLVSACCELGISLRTVKRWRRAFGGDGNDADRRKGSSRLVSHRPSEEERQRILLTCNQLEYASLPPGQIVPALADQGHYIGSESSFYRVLHQAGQCQRRGRARPPQAARTVPRLRADGPNQLWSWDITYLPTTVRGVWLYPHQQPLILHADNGNAMRAAKLESRLEELGVLRSFSRPRVSNDNPYSESLFRTVKFRPDYPSRPLASKAEACEWVAVSNSSRLSNATAVPPSPSAGNAPRSTKRLARPTQNAGANPLAAGANQ
jgi:transposase